MIAHTKCVDFIKIKGKEICVDCGKVKGKNLFWDYNSGTFVTEEEISRGTTLHSKIREELLSKMHEAFDDFRVISCNMGDLRAYNKDGNLISDAKFAVEKMREVGYIYQPLKDGDTLIIIKAKEKQNDSQPEI